MHEAIKIINASPAHILYELHENEDMSKEVKIMKTLEFFPELKGYEKWEALQEFFNTSELIVSESYYCCTYWNGKMQSEANRYTINSLDETEIRECNFRFYELLSVIEGKNKIKSVVSGLLNGTKITDKHLDNYAFKKNIRFLNGGRRVDRLAIILSFEKDNSIDAEGYEIYRCIELPL